MIYLRYEQLPTTTPRQHPTCLFLRRPPPRLESAYPSPAYSQHSKHEPLLDTRAFFVTNPCGTPNWRWKRDMACWRQLSSDLGGGANYWPNDQRQASSPCPSCRRYGPRAVLPVPSAAVFEVVVMFPIAGVLLGLGQRDMQVRIVVTKNDFLAELVIHKSKRYAIGNIDLQSRELLRVSRLHRLRSCRAVIILPRQKTGMML